MGSKTKATSTEETVFADFADSLFVNFQFVLFMCQLEKVKGSEQCFVVKVQKAVGMRFFSPIAVKKS
jgi:hypothetical protein